MGFQHLYINTLLGVPSYVYDVYGMVPSKSRNRRYKSGLCNCTIWRSATLGGDFGRRSLIVVNGASLDMSAKNA
jgi:hypothetical protein